MASNINVAVVRKQMYNILKEYRATCMSPNFIPTLRFLEFLRCSLCNDLLTTRSVFVFWDTLQFSCKNCSTKENLADLVLIPQNYLAQIRFPCRWAWRGCDNQSSFGLTWRMHNLMCIYHMTELEENEAEEDQEVNELECGCVCECRLNTPGRECVCVCECSSDTEIEELREEDEDKDKKEENEEDKDEEEEDEDEEEDEEEDEGENDEEEEEDGRIQRRGCNPCLIRWRNVIQDYERRSETEEEDDDEEYSDDNFDDAQSVN